jgi:hypothetical protein
MVVDEVPPGGRLFQARWRPIATALLGFHRTDADAFRPGGVA